MRVLRLLVDGLLDKHSRFGEFREKARCGPKSDIFSNPCCPESVPREEDEIRNSSDQQDHFGSYLLQLLSLVSL
jgi:hypothetical protein